MIAAAEAAAGSVPGVIHAHAKARWTWRTLRIEIEGWVDPDLPARGADAIGRPVAGAVSWQLPEAGSLTWASLAATTTALTTTPACRYALHHWPAVKQQVRQTQGFWPGAGVLALR